MRIKLQRKPLQILELLLERAGEVVPREELRRRVWPEEPLIHFDRSFNTALCRLRQSLGDSADHPQCIETLAGQGYRFVAEVSPLEETAAAGAAAGEGRGWKAVLAGRGHLVAASLLAAVALVGSGYFGWKMLLARTQPAKTTLTVAVLPFANLSGQAEQEFFSDGLTEEMIQRLAQLDPQRLRVIARSSAMTYKGSRRSAAEIGRELGADHVLEGSVQRNNGRVRISVQLIHAKEQTQLWAKTYERNVSDLPGIHREVVEQVARSLALEILHGRPHSTLLATDSQTYEAYLKGRYYWNRRTEADLRRALQFFQGAVHKDRNFAPAYVGIADCYEVMAGWAWLSPAEAYPKAKAAAERALQLDPSLAEAHAALATAIWEYEWAAARAEEEFSRALALNPSYATGHQRYAEFLVAFGRHDQALAEIEKARQLDPLSLIINALAGYIHYHARQYDRSIEASRKALELDPDFAPAHLYLSWAYAKKGMYPQAVQERQVVLRLNGAGEEKVAALGQAFRTGGINGARRWLLRDLIGQTYVCPYRVAALYAELGEKKEALDWLGKAYQARSEALLRLAVDPRLDDLRAEPRFQELLRRLPVAPGGPRWNRGGPNSGS